MGGLSSQLRLARNDTTAGNQSSAEAVSGSRQLLYTIYVHDRCHRSITMVSCSCDDTVHTTLSLAPSMLVMRLRKCISRAIVDSSETPGSNAVPEPNTSVTLTL